MPAVTVQGDFVNVIVETGSAALSMIEEMPASELPSQPPGGASAGMSSDSPPLRVFSVQSRAVGLTREPEDGRTLGRAVLIGDGENVRLVLRPFAGSHVGLEQTEDTVGLLLALAFENPVTERVVTYLDVEHAHYVWVLFRLGFVWLEDELSNRQGACALLMRRTSFMRLTPWGKRAGV